MSYRRLHVYWWTTATIAAFAVSLFVHTATVKFRDCAHGEVEHITIEPCHATPCHFDKGESANLSITFVPRQTTNSAKVRNTLRRGGLLNYEVEVALQDPHVCRSDGSITATTMNTIKTNTTSDWGKVECPLVGGQRYTFSISRPFPMSSSYNIFRYSKLRFIGDDNRLIACADMRLQFHRVMWKGQEKR